MTEIDHTEITEAATSEDRHQRLVAVLIIVVTLLGAIVAYLQTQAGNREATADRNAQQSSVQTMGALVETTRRDAIESQTYDVANDLDWEGYAFETVERRSDEAVLFAGAMGRANRAAARALTQFRLDLFDGQYKRAGNVFDRVAFFEDEWKPFYRADEFQKAYAVERDGWSEKSDRFVTVITVIAVSLFLLGLSLTVPGSARRLFLWMGSAVGLVAAVWALIVFLGDVEQPNAKAIDAYVQAQARSDFAEASGDAKRRKRSLEEVIDFATVAIEEREDYVEAYLVRAHSGFTLDFLRPDGPRGSEEVRDDLEHATALDPTNYLAWGNLGAAQFWLDDYRAARRSTERALELQPNDAIYNMNRALVLSLLEEEVEYREQLRTVRRVLARQPSWLRELSIMRYQDVFRLGEKYRPRVAEGILRFRDDLHEIDREIAISLKMLGTPTSPPTTAKAENVRIERADDGDGLVARFSYTGVKESSKYAYETWVGGELDFSYGPRPWALDAPDGRAFIELNRSDKWKKGARLEFDLFVDGHLIGRAAYTIP